MIVEHARENRPWGSFVTACKNETDVTTKILRIDPKRRTSLQIHENRDEMWLLVSGKIRAIVGDEEYILDSTKKSQRDGVFVPRKSKHRLENLLDNHQSVVMEVAYGEFDEDDNTRIEDDFGRA